MTEHIGDCQTLEELSEAIACLLKQGGMHRDYFDQKTGLRETRYDELETRRVYGIALNNYNEIRKLYPNLPSLQIATSDPLSGLAQIQQLCTNKQESLQEIIEVLKNWQKSEKTEKDFNAAKSALPPIAKTYEILCRSKGRCGSKTTDLIRWLGSASNNRSGYCPALLNNFASPEVIADLEKWQEEPAKTKQGDKDTKRELGEIHKWYQTNIFKFVVIPVVIPLGVALFLGIPSWLSLGNKTDHSQTASTNIFAYVSKDGTILQSKNFPWKISKSKDNDDNIVYIINGRYGDSSAASVFPDDSRNEYILYNSISGVAVKFTCPEEKIPNFTIKLKY